jgi:peptidoglycan/LPS O-acetylase OafA/YrhL
MMTYVTGLRGLAIVAILMYEVVKHAPGILFSNSFVHRAAFDGMHGFEVFLVLSGFVLAYPTLAALRGEGTASFDLRRFAIGRNARLLPAYYVALALTIALPYAAARYGLTAFGHPATLPTPATIALQLFFLQNHFQNDAFWALGLQMRVFFIFPLLFAAYIRTRWIFVALAIAACCGDLFTAAHQWDLGVFVPFMLGIVAADLRLQPQPWIRYALPAALVAGIAAFFTDPFVAMLPGPHLGGGIESWNPFWAIAAFALVVAAGSLRPLERAFTIPGLAQIGAASYATALVAEPIAAYVLRKATPTLGLEVAAVNAFLITLVFGIVFWAVVDRRFAETQSRQRTVETFEGWLKRLRDAFTVRSLRFELVPVPVVAAAQPAPELLPVHGDLAMLMKRTGSPDDLAADISATRARFAERGSFDPFYFEPRRVAPMAVDPEPEAERSVIHLHFGPGDGLDSYADGRP